jgi:hypothetical protein
VPTIQPADPAARRQAVAILLCVLLVGLGLIAALERSLGDFEKWLEDNLEFILANTWLVFLAALVPVLPIAGFAIYLLGFAKKIASAQRFPPPGYAVTRDTVVLEGTAARRRAALLRVLSIGLLLLSGAAPVYLWYIFVQIVVDR